MNKAGSRCLMWTPSLAIKLKRLKFDRHIELGMQLVLVQRRDRHVIIGEQSLGDTSQPFVQSTVAGFLVLHITQRVAKVILATMGKRTVCLVQDIGLTSDILVYPFGGRQQVVTCIGDPAGTGVFRPVKKIAH